MFEIDCVDAHIFIFWQAAFPDHNSQFSVLNALVVGICGSTSAIGGGALTDRLALRYGKHVSTTYNGYVITVLKSWMPLVVWWSAYLQ